MEHRRAESHAGSRHERKFHFMFKIQYKTRGGSGARCAVQCAAAAVILVFTDFHQITPRVNQSHCRLNKFSFYAVLCINLVSTQKYFLQKISEADIVCNSQQWMCGVDNICS